jgi:transcriptional regulator of aromatic amino acid metabolism
MGRMSESHRQPRLFIDAHGVAWRVSELQPREHARALYFENDGAFRRVTDYPADWRELPTGELEILSYRR